MTARWLALTIPLLIIAGFLVAGGEGPKFGPPFDLPAKSSRSFLVTLEGGKEAEVWVESEHNTDVDLFVFSPEGEGGALDTEVSRDCHVKLTPPKTLIYRVHVINRDLQKANRCRVKHTGKPHEARLLASKAFDLKGNEEMIFQVKVAAQQFAGLLVTSETSADVDMWVYDSAGKEIGADRRFNKDCYLGFTPEREGTYRVKVRNMSGAPNRCVLECTASQPTADR